MSKSEVNEDNYNPVDKDKLKDEQKVELDRATKVYEQECLKSLSATRAGEVVKKFEFPTLQPLIEAQRDNRILDIVHQAVGQAASSDPPPALPPAAADPGGGVISSRPALPPAETSDVSSPMVITMSMKQKAAEDAMPGSRVLAGVCVSLWPSVCFAAAGRALFIDRLRWHQATHISNRHRVCSLTAEQGTVR